ncbi:MAG: hypothetical protein IJT21_07105 [Synergistaceae bacterium]|nr:hypothetical protein [Synergistaceae bacterium]
MNMKPAKFLSYIFASIIILFLCSVLYQLASRGVEKIAEKESNIHINWEKLYPFENPIYAHTRLTQESVLKRTYKYLKARFIAHTSERLLLYIHIVEAANKYRNFINWNISHIAEYNAVIKLKHGHFATFTKSFDVSEKVASVRNFANFCESHDIKFFYVNLPNQICKSEDKDIAGTLDFSNQNADNFLQMLGDYGVKYYDMREILHDQGMNHHEAFFITDHHWKPETGLWAAREILKFLRNGYKWPVNPEILNPENFDYVIYRDWYLGSYGQKITLVRAKPEDFTMIYPKFDTLLKLEIPDKKINISGDFRIIYDMKQLNEKDYYSLSPYQAYMYGGRPIVKIENLLAHNEKKLMMVYDSFSLPVIPFMALDIKHIEAIDLRQFNGSLETYIKRNKPDLIIAIYYIEMLAKGNKSQAAVLFNFR